MDIMKIWEAILPQVRGILLRRIRHANKNTKVPTLPKHWYVGVEKTYSGEKHPFIEIIMEDNYSEIITFYGDEIRLISYDPFGRWEDQGGWNVENKEICW